MNEKVYILKDEKNKVIFNREEKGEFTTGVYQLLINELIDKLKDDLTYYSEKLIELKNNKYDINTVSNVSKALGYKVEHIDYEEYSNIKFKRK